MNALAADIAPSPTTRAAIGTVQSVRQGLATAGWKSVAGNFFRPLTCTGSSLFLVIWPRWRCRTRRFYKGRSQEKTLVHRLGFFLLRSPLDRAQSVLTDRAVCSVVG